jgi:hypothetical protein
MSHDDFPADSSAWTWRITNYSAQVGTGKAISWVRCSVEGHPGVKVWLTADLLPDDAGTAPLTLSAQTGSRPDYGPYFCEIGPVKAGHYTLTVEILDVLAPLWLDGTASATVIFAPVATLRSPGAGSSLPPVLLLGQLMASQANFLALTRYVAHFGAVVTFDPDEAVLAKHVILIGSPQLVSEEIEKRLKQAGVRVERAQGTIAELLDRTVAADSPFLQAQP